MNILFLTALKIETLKKRGIYHDLMREFASHNHHIYIVSPIERRESKPSSLTSEGNVHFLTIGTLNVQKTNIIEKGLATLSIELLFLRGIKKYFDNVKFDLVICSTPPITYTKVIDYVKKKDGAKSYLLLKDIFPQNAVDMKMMSKKGLIHRFFRKKEKSLYEISDAIGCMSEANKKYILTHNPEICKDKVHINHNSIEPTPHITLTVEQQNRIKKKHQLPTNKKIFIYGGNLGIPQGLDFLLETIEANKSDTRMFFLIVGSGTEFTKIENWFSTYKPQNAKLIAALPKKEYDQLVSVCDVGMIFLNKDFTIPNFPSRLLSHLEFKQPILVAADNTSDIGTEIERNHCGFSVISGDIVEMKNALNNFCNMNVEEFETYRNNSRKYLEENFLVSQSYEKIMNKIKQLP